MQLNEKLEIHEQLNQKLFDGDQLRPDVLEKINDIVNTFIDSLWIKPKVLDVQLVGSNASYNYTIHSDIDLHIIINFEDLQASPEIVNAMYNLEKTQFNKDHDITIKGLDVELYIEDVNAGAISNGIYSIKYNKWIKYPNKITNIPEYDLSKQLQSWKNVIEKVIDNKDKDQISEVIDKLYMIRKNSIAIDGEYGKGNQLFKEIRNEGLLDKLKDEFKKQVSRDLSLESFLDNHTIEEMFITQFED